MSAQGNTGGGAEVAMALVLVAGALLLGRSLLRLQQVDVGVRIENVVTMSADLPLSVYPTGGLVVGFVERVVDSSGRHRAS